MAETGRRRSWEDLGKDLLVLVLSRLGVADLHAAFFVCSSWRSASAEPSLWRTLDFRYWDDPPAFPRLLRFAVARTAGSLERIYFPDSADEADLLFVAERCPVLGYLHIKNGDISTQQFCRAVGNLKCLTSISIHTNLVCKDVFLQLSVSCRNFSELRILGEDLYIKGVMVICRYLPSLKKLELIDCKIAQISLSYFLDKLKKLEYLDVSGYGRVGITAAILEKASCLKVFNWGSVIDEGEFSGCLDSDNEVDSCQFMKYLAMDE